MTNKQAEEKLKILAEKAKSLGLDKILLFIRIDNMAISKIVGFEDTEIIEALFKLGQEFAKQCNVGLKIEKIDDNEAIKDILRRAGRTSF